MVLPNQASSTNCYSDSGAAATNNLMWNAALVSVLIINYLEDEVVTSNTIKNQKPFNILFIL